VTTEVASTRLPRETIRELDREATTRGISRSVYLAELIERRVSDGASTQTSVQVDALAAGLTGQLREIRESQRNIAQALRDVQASLKPSGSPPVSDVGSSLIERLTFSTFFSEALIKRVGALLHRNPGELGQVVREAREQAEAEAKLWRERLQAGQSQKGSA
jgi:predicted DNA-binding protein